MPIPQIVADWPTAEGGLQTYRNLDLGSTGKLIKSAAGKVYGWVIYNAASAVRYLKLYDGAAAPTVGTDTPLLTVGLAATALTAFYLPAGIQFVYGIGAGAVTGVADANTTAPTANDVVVNIFYW